MNDSNLIKYFKAEKAEGILGSVIGLISISIGALFILNDTDFIKGVSYPLMLFGLLEVGVFLTVAIRTPKDIARVTTWFNSETAKIRTAEIPRMKKVMKNFLYYRWAEAALLIAGILIFFAESGEILKGIGVGVIIHSFLLLIMDAFAERRGQAYLNFLKSIDLR